MATHFSVKQRSKTQSVNFVFLFALVILSSFAGWLVFFYSQRMDLALYTGWASALVLGIWWFLLQWQTSITWFCNFQLFLAQLNLLPREYVYQDDASPLKIKTLMNLAIKAGLQTLENKDKEIISIQNTLEKYLGPEVARQARGGVVSSAGQMQKAFILFSEIRGFPEMSEQLNPPEIFKILNQIYSLFETAIAGQGGEINKIMGDSILVFFRRSVEKETEEALKVIHAAKDIQTKIAQSMKNSPELNSKSISIGLGISIVAGEVLLGNLTSRNRIEITLIGDPVNLAARFCRVAPEWEILVNEELAKMVSNKFHLESRMPVQLKGKTDLIIPYRIMGERTPPPPLPTP